MSSNEINEVHAQVRLLRKALMELVERDPEQEVRGALGITAVDAVLDQARSLLPADHPVVGRLREVISPEVIESEDPIRAADLLHVVNAIYGPIAILYTDWVNAKSSKGMVL